MRMLRRRIFARLALASAILALAPLAAAAQESPSPTTADWVFRWLNFALIFGVGGWWAGRKLKVVFRRKAEQIASSIAEAEAARREAEQRLREAEAELASVESEAQQMRERARRDSAAEVERIGELARQEAARVERAAEAEIGAAERSVANRLRELTVEKTMQRARALVAERLTPAVDRGLCGRFIEALGAGGSQS